MGRKEEEPEYPAPEREFPQSKFVRRLMPNASDAEYKEANERWFTFLGILNDVIQREEDEAELAAMLKRAQEHEEIVALFKRAGEQREPKQPTLF